MNLDELRQKVQIHFYLLPAVNLIDPANVGWWAREAGMEPPTDATALGGWLKRDSELRHPLIQKP